MFDLYPRNSHRTPQQIAEDSGGTFEPRTVTRTRQSVVQGEDARRDAHGEGNAKELPTAQAAR